MTREQLTARVRAQMGEDWAFDQALLVRDATAACLARANAPTEGHYAPPNEHAVQAARWAYDPAFVKRVAA